MNRVSAQDAHEALIYKGGILDYEAHDRVLQGKGYVYLALPCNCGGNDDDGHMPCCGWGRPSTKMVGTEALGNGNDHFGVHERNAFCAQRGCISAHNLGPASAEMSS